jgi:hypothetical protein
MHGLRVQRNKNARVVCMGGGAGFIFPKLNIVLELVVWSFCVNNRMISVWSRGNQQFGFEVSYQAAADLFVVRVRSCQI